MQNRNLLLVGILNQANNISAAALPLGGSIIAYEILLKVYLCQLQNQTTPLKSLFAIIPYSQMGIRFHLRKLLDDGWIQLTSSDQDRRTKICIPTEKLMLAWADVMDQIGVWLEAQVLEVNDSDSRNNFFLFSRPYQTESVAKIKTTSVVASPKIS